MIPVKERREGGKEPTGHREWEGDLPVLAHANVVWTRVCLVHKTTRRPTWLAWRKGEHGWDWQQKRGPDWLMNCIWGNQEGALKIVQDLGSRKIWFYCGTVSVRRTSLWLKQYFVCFGFGNCQMCSLMAIRCSCLKDKHGFNFQFFYRFNWYDLGQPANVLGASVPLSVNLE